ncbi:MAG: hypothetical protein S0880_28305 [Actinomycetota bacterium]|nr:hypothetical protein [Actinomycetota bacterium]
MAGRSVRPLVASAVVVATLLTPTAIGAWEQLPAPADVGPGDADPGDEATAEQPVEKGDGLPPALTDPGSDLRPTPHPVELVSPADSDDTGATPSVSDPEGPDELGIDDDVETGTLVDGFGTGATEAGTARISGTLGTRPPAPVGDLRAEDDGSIRSATVVDVEPGEALSYEATIGDGPYGSTSGDVDMFVLLDVTEGAELVVEVETEHYDEPVDAEVGVYEIATGEMIAYGDDGAGGFDFDPTVVIAAPADGDYVVVVTGCCGQPTDLADSTSGTGVAAVGDYQVLIGVDSTTSVPVDGSSTEDDGSIDTANPVELEVGRSVTYEGVLGDGPHGDVTGDVDFYALGEVAEGVSIVVDTDTSGLANPIDTMVAVYDASGTMVASNDDDGVGLDSLLRVPAPADGEYFAAVVACCQFPLDPFDPTTVGLPTEPGGYRVDLGLGVIPRSGMGDIDVFLVDLAVGDAFAAGFTGSAGTVDVYDPDGTLVMGSGWSASLMYPVDSPLRHVGDVGVDHVAATAGRHAVVVRNGAGAYQGELRVVRSAAGATDERQIVFLDTDGAMVEPSTLDPAAQPSAGLSRLSAFLFRWGLDPADEDRVVEAMVRRVEDVFAELDGGTSAIDLRWSGHDPDPWGTEGVSRVVIGGSQAQSGLVTTGIAESVDPGNLDRDETALVLLDLLSAASDPDSINGIDLAPGASKADLVGSALGAVVAHEVGHLLGSWHTDASNDVASIMDGGSPLVDLVGVGADGIYGTADDELVGFTADTFDPNEGYTGVQDTAARTRAALPVPGGRFADDPFTDDPVDEVGEVGDSDEGDEAPTDPGDAVPVDPRLLD